MTERWADVLGYGGLYQVSDKGRVRLRKPTSKNKAGRILKQTVKEDGYMMVCVSDGGKFRYRYVHRLVAETFMPSHPGKTEVNHIDGNKANNCLSNLEWVTHRENQLHARDVLGRFVKPRYSLRKLTPEQVLEIRSSDEPQRTLADRYGVSQATIRNIIYGHIYKEVR